MILLVILVFAIIAIIFFVNSYQNKYQSFQGVVFNFIIVILLLFLLISVFFVYKNSDVNLTSFQGVVDFGKIYFSWILHFFQNSGGILGYAINQDWKGNVTEVSK